MRYPAIILTLLVNLGAAHVCAADDIHHLILIWQKAGTPASQTETLLQETRYLEKIPGVKSILINTPVTSDRPVVDDSFSYAILMTFASAQDMQNYQQHPQHLQFLKDNIQGKMEKLVIYDF
jgi:hypothetical protein